MTIKRLVKEFSEVMSSSRRSPIPVLIVDDEAPLREALARYLDHEGFASATADCGAAALDYLKTNSVSLMLLDIRMPGLSGIEVVPKALEMDPRLAIVMLTAVADAASATRCLQSGAMDYLTKPVELTELLSAVHRALHRRETMIQRRGLVDWLRRELERKSDEFIRERFEQGQITLATLETMVNTLEAKNRHLVGHSARVAVLATTVAQESGLSEQEIEQVRIAGRLHDLGKIGIREEVVNKEGPLTEEEYEHVKEHTEIGSRILEPLPNIGPIASYVRGHHERWDGSGYPDGLRGEEIPLGARILCIAEVYDALTSSRPYHDVLPGHIAIERMRSLAGTMLDPVVMDTFVRALDRRRHLLDAPTQSNATL